MFKHPAIKISLLLAITSLISCENSDQQSTELLIYNVGAQVGDRGYRARPQESPPQFQIVARGSGFFSTDSLVFQVDSGTTIPSGLFIEFEQQGQLVPSLLKPFGYKVTTRFEFEDASEISVNHTNVADSLFVADGGSQGDTLYVAIRGEGLVSVGRGLFENASGLFFEQSTYRIVDETVTGISCRYELSIEY